MKKFRVYYWKEINDECVDCEKDIEALDKEDALRIFKLQTRVYKHDIKIEEI